MKEAFSVGGEGLKAFCFIQARVGSTRLPGKVLKQLHGRSLLEWVIRRAERIHPSVEVVVLTGDKPANDPIVDLARSLGKRCMRGEEDNVLGRFVAAADRLDADYVVRLTGDNPLVDYELAKALFVMHLSYGGEYTSSKSEMGSQFPDGIGVEIFSRKTLRALLDGGPDEETIEHLNERILRNPRDFRCLVLRNPVDMSGYGFSVDTEEDFRRVEEWMEWFPAGDLLSPTLWKSIVDRLAAGG